MRIIKSIRPVFPFILAGVLILVYGCNKVKVYANTDGGAAFINAVPDTTFDAADTGLLVVIGTDFRSDPLPYLGSTNYLVTPSGTWPVELRSSLDSAKSFFSAASEPFASNTAVSYFIYDTLSVTDSTLNVLRLNDDLTPPPPGVVTFRFLNLAVNSIPLDVTFARSDAQTDSLTISGQAYIGDTPDAAMLSAFNRQVPFGLYTVSLKEAGTQNILASGPIILDEAGIYTFYATGLASGLPLTIGVKRHYP